MTDTKHASGTLALRAALAIIESTGNPARWHGARPITAGDLATIIQRELNRTMIPKAIDETMEEIEYHNADMLTEHERNHPRGSGWARVYDKLATARDLLKERAASDSRPVDEDELRMDLILSWGRFPKSASGEQFADAAIRALQTHYHLVRKA